MAGITLGNVYGLMVVTVNLDLLQLTTGVATDQTHTVPGVRVGDVVMMTADADFPAGLVIGGARVSARDTVVIRLGNVTAGTINPAPAAYTFTIIRPDTGVRAGVVM